MNNYGNDVIEIDEDSSSFYLYLVWVSATVFSSHLVLFSMCNSMHLFCLPANTYKKMMRWLLDGVKLETG